MRLHHALPHTNPLLPPGTAKPITPANAGRRQRIKDQLAVLAVFLLILATAAVIVSYVAHEAPRWRAGAVGNFEPTPVPAVAQLSPAAGTSSVAAVDPISGLGRVPLILISTVVEMAIFVALGLYLRHDMNRKP